MTIIVARFRGWLASGIHPLWRPTISCFALAAILPATIAMAQDQVSEPQAGTVRATVRIGEEETVGFRMLVPNANGAGSRFRATTQWVPRAERDLLSGEHLRTHMVPLGARDLLAGGHLRTHLNALSENDSRPFPQEASLVHLPIRTWSTL
ncbi:MAG: hypothetical protein EA424_03415, partial [Planctomycetaceae bacterium]